MFRPRSDLPSMCMRLAFRTKAADEVPRGVKRVNMRLALDAAVNVAIRRFCFAMMAAAEGFLEVDFMLLGTLREARVARELRKPLLRPVTILTFLAVSTGFRSFSEALGHVLADFNLADSLIFTWELFSSF